MINICVSAQNEETAKNNEIVKTRVFMHLCLFLAQLHCLPRRSESIFKFALSNVMYRSLFQQESELFCLFAKLYALARVDFIKNNWM